MDMASLTMNALLGRCGIDLTRPVGVIVEQESMSGEFVVAHAIRGMILDSLPSCAVAEYPDFDPLSDVAVLWQTDTGDKLLVIELLDGAEVIHVAPGRMNIQHQMYRVFFGQSEQFLEFQQELAQQLPQQRC